MDDPYDWQALYPRGLSRAWAPPEQSLWRFLADAAERWPDRVALTFEGATRTFGDLWQGGRSTGAFLRRLGARPGDRMLIVLPNCPEFVEAYHGALAAGLVVVAASPHLTAAELGPIVERAEPRVVVRDHALAGRFDETLLARGVAPRAIVSAWPGHATSHDGDLSECDLVVQAPGEPAVLQTTSGTTGGLKAATMSHRNLVANALQNNAWFGWTRDDVILGALPLCHTWGMCCVMNAALAAGARIAMVRDFDAGRVLETIARERVTVAYGSATMFHRLLDAAGAAAPERFASLRYVKAGAMLVGSDLYARWTAAVPNVPMINGYGLTEAGPEVTNNPPHARRAGTVGVPLPGTELRLGVVPDAERVVDDGVVDDGVVDDGVVDDGVAADTASGAGEVQIRGPQVMSGYWRNDDATRAAFTGDGWLRTGDLARFDDAGYLVILDRLKDLIKYRGWSVVPGEVERALREHPEIAEACVVGVPDPRDGEVPVAYVVLRAGAVGAAGDAADDAARAASFARHLAPRLATYKHPRRIVVVDEIPKNHVGKPLRRVLRARGAAPFTDR